MEKKMTRAERMALIDQMLEEDEKKQLDTAYGQGFASATTASNPISREWNKMSSAVTDIGYYYDVLTAKTPEERAKIAEQRRLEQMATRGVNASGLNPADKGTAGLVGDMALGIPVGLGSVATKRGIEKGIKYGIDKAVKGTEYLLKKQVKDKAQKVADEALNEASELLLNNKIKGSFKSKIADDVTDLVSQGIAFTPEAQFGTTEDADGNMKAYADNSVKGFLMGLGMNIAGDTILSHIPSSVIRHVTDYKTKKILRDDISNSTYAKFNMEKEGISAVYNNKLFNDFDNLDKNSHMYKAMDEGASNQTAMPDYTNIAKNKEELQTYLDELDSKYGSYAVKYGDDVYIKNNKGNELVGKYVDGDILINTKTSDIPDAMITTKYNGKRLLEPTVHKDVESYKKGKQYSELKTIRKVGDNLVKANGKALNEAELNKLNNNEVFKSFDGIKLSDKYTNQNIVTQAIVTPMSKEDIAKIKNKDIRTLKEKMNEVPINENKNISVTLEGATKGNERDINALGVLFESAENEKGSNLHKYKNLNKEVYEAIKYAVVKDAKNFNEAKQKQAIWKKTGDYTKNLSDRIANIAADILVKNNKKVNVEDVKKYLKNIVDDVFIKDNIKVLTNEKGEAFIDTNFVINPEVFDVVAKNIDFIDDTHYYTKTEWENLSDDKKVDIKEFGEYTPDGKIVTPDRAKEIIENAKAEANTEYFINKEGIEIVRDLITKIKEKMDKKGISIEGIRYVKGFGDKTNKEIKKWYNKLNIDEQEAIKDSINKLIEDFNYIDNLVLENPNADTLPLHFATKLDGNGRVYFKSLVNPKTKLGRVVFVQDKQKRTIGDLFSNEKDVITAKRSILSMMGEKPHRMTDEEVVTTWNTFKSELLENGKLKDTSSKKGVGNEYFDDGILSSYIMKNFEKISNYEDGAIDANTPYFDINEVDGINNGFALQLAYINKKNASVGLGDVPNKSQDMYETFANDIGNRLKGDGNGVDDFELARSDTKGLATAAMYNASIYETTKSLAQTLINSIKNTVGKIEDNTKKKMEVLFRTIDYKFLQNSNIDLDIEVGLLKTDLENAHHLMYLNSKGKLNKEAQNNLFIENDIYKSIEKLSDNLDGKENDKKLNEKIKNIPFKGFVKIVYNRAKKAHKKAKDKGKTEAFSYFFKDELSKLEYVYKDLSIRAKMKGYLEYNARLTEYQHNSLLHKFTEYDNSKFIDITKNSIKNVFGEDVMQLKSIIDTNHKFAKYVFAKNYTMENIDKTTALKYIDEFADILGTDKNIVENAKNKLTDGEKYSLKKLVNIMAKAGAKVDGRLQQHYAIRKIIPVMNNPFAGTKAVTIKGFAGYDRLHKENYKDLTPIGVFNPSYTISHDAGLMARGRSGVTSIWDAGIGSVDMVNDFAKNMNYQINTILNTDYVKLFKEDNDKLFETIVGGAADGEVGLNDVAIDFLAEQELLQKGKIITKKGIEEVKIRIKKELSEFRSKTKTSFDNELNRLSEMVEANKKEWREGDTIAQYYIGDKHTTSEYQKFDVDVEPIDNGLYFNTRDISKNYLADVEPLKDGEVIVNLKSGYKKFTQIDYKEPDIKFDTETTQYVDDTVMLSFSKKDLNKHENIAKVLHEISHHVVRKMQQNNSVATKQLQQFIQELIVSGKLRDKDGNQLMLTNADPEEYLAIVIEKLLHNNLMANNASLFARLYKTRNIKKLIDDNSFTVDGNPINNLTEFANLIKKQTDEGTQQVLLQEFDGLVRNTYLMFKGNVQLLAEINNKKLKTKFNSTLKQADKAFEESGGVLQKGYGYVYGKIEQISLLEAFDITDKKEALYYALSLKDGFVKAIDDATATFSKEFDSIKKQNGVDEKMDKDAGNFLMLGLHNFNKLFKQYDNHIDFIKALNNNVEQDFKTIKTWFEKLGNNDMLKELEKTLSNEAHGVYSQQNVINTKINTIVNKMIDAGILDATNNMHYKNMLQAYAQKRVTYYKLNGRYKGIDEKYRITVLNEDSLKTDMYKKSLGRIFSSKNRNEKFGNYLDIVTHYHKKYRNDANLFGVNPALETTSTYLVGIKAKDFKGSKKDSVGEVYIDGERYIVTTRDKSEYVMGKQGSNILNIGNDEHMQGVYKFKIKGDKVKKFINPSSLRLSNNRIDSKASTMLARNFYYQHRKTQEANLLLMQYNQLKEAGILLTAEEIPLDEIDNYIKLPEKNGISKIAGQLYVPRKYEHYFVGTKGLKYGKIIDDVLGNNDLGKFVKGMIKLTFELTRVLKGTILVAHASSYINSFVGSMIILNAHTKGKSNLYVARARSLFKEYKELMNKVIEAETKHGDNSVEYKTALSKLEQHKLHNAFRHGLSSTIRSSAMHLGVYEENWIVQKINKIFRDDRAGEAFKFVTLNENTPVGSKLGEFFDGTEMYPKLALYLHELDNNGGDYELAIKKVLMAFPTYYNINKYLAAFDEISPYTKYFYNIPKMIGYAGIQSPISTAVAASIIPALTYMSWDDSDEKKYEWYIEHGFAKIGDSAYYAYNLNPYSIPMDWEKDSLLDNIFLYNVIHKMSFKPDLNPFVDLEAKN